MTVQASIILRLIDQIPDVDLRRQITAQYYQDVEAQANFVQNRVGHLEIDLRDMLQQQLGATNEMVSEVLAIGRRQEGAVNELRHDFQSLAETVDQHAADIASFHESRKLSIAERKQHSAELKSIHDDQESVHKELADARVERQRMADMLKRIEDMLTVAAARVDRLERGDSWLSE